MKMAFMMLVSRKFLKKDKKHTNALVGVYHQQVMNGENCRFFAIDKQTSTKN